MSKSTIHFTAILGSEQMTKMMQAMDVFEKSRVVGTINKMIFTLEEGIKADEERVKLTMKNAVIACKQSGEILSAMHFDYYQNDELKVYNKGLITPYFNPDIRTVSDGSQFFLLSKFLQSLGWHVITDNHMFIKAVGLELGDNLNEIEMPTS